MYSQRLTKYSRTSELHSSRRERKLIRITLAGPTSQKRPSTCGLSTTPNSRSCHAKWRAPGHLTESFPPANRHLKCFVSIGRFKDPVGYLLPNSRKMIQARCHGARKNIKLTIGNLARFIQKIMFSNHPS